VQKESTHFFSNFYDFSKLDITTEKRFKKFKSLTLGPTRQHFLFKKNKMNRFNAGERGLPAMELRRWLRPSLAIDPRQPKTRSKRENDP
jgi:hypothetical protein